ncbi:hypothetical protein BSL78_16505 [Apostichopus japonicus]|uniref:Netrin receptor UNC5 n=1 Tax=Stichopus japonicus TaxID=307972 RepID=A0A2G8KF94_STIJA|nr:hypothetical protein BSL78_16505 [Apostichopus japonicus]
MVNVADDLTLDSTLKLATLFGLPPAETDMLRRVSLIETPGITLINFMKTRNIINLYDVTNLQKGLVYIQLNRTNENLLAPYQSKVDPFQFEENQAPELLAWPVDESTPSQGSDEREEYHDHHKETLMERTEKEELPKQRKDSQILEMRQNHSYIEHRIKYEGGTISIMGGQNDTLIKLEPEGLVLNKPAQLTIPHSAIIPEPDRHDVIIFTGLKDEETSQEGEITWTEEKSIDWKLYPEKISLDINILSYVFVNLVSQETEQKHIFRIVPFIDGILDAKDDVLITVCFCKDSDEDYKHVDIDHLCAASRVSHQFRLNRNKYGDTDMVDVKLKVSQHEKNQTALILQSKVKNILLSPESQEILFRELHPGVYFELKPAENETIQTAAESGKMLMKILDERELIMPDRMIGMYQGLKAIHFNKVARLVLEYIGKISKETGNLFKKGTKVVSKFQNFVRGGIQETGCPKSLKLSHGKLDLGRRLLLLAKEEHERLPLFPGSNLYKEQYFDQHGGEMVIAGVILRVPAGHYTLEGLFSLWVSADPAIKGPISNKSLRLTPFVKFGPESLTLHKPVSLIIPYCAITTTNQMGIDVYSGVLQTGMFLYFVLCCVFLLQ